MQKVGEVLKKTALQGLPEMLGQESFLARKMAEARLVESAPAKSKVIKTPKECPWKNSYRQCEDCKEGKRTEARLEPEPIKLLYDVAKCYSYVKHKELISKSGLAGIELQHTFENAYLNCHNERLYRYLMSWDHTRAGGIYIGAHKDINNPQGNGTGKSYALHSLVHRLCRIGVPCLYSRTVDFLMQLRAAYDDGTQESESKVLRRYTHIPVLLWDDLGKENFKTDWAPEKFYYVIDYRVRTNRPMIISSNFSLAEIETRFGLYNFGPAIASRLAGFCEMWTLGGPDRRIQKSSKKGDA